MAEEYEYVDVETINVQLDDGTEMECAIIDQFDYQGQGYIVLSPIEDDEVTEDMFIYRCEEDGEDVILDDIEDDDELNAVTDYYNQVLAELE